MATPRRRFPGEFLGSFFFSGTLIADAGNGQATSCQVAIPLPDGGSLGSDAGILFFPTSPQFYAELSLLSDAGEVVWQLTGVETQDGGPVRETGLVRGATFTVVTQTQALIERLRLHGGT